MNEADRDRLAQMLRYGEAAVRLLGTADAGALAADEKTFFAISYALQTLGEAANRVSMPTRSKLNDIPWVRVIGMRHHLVHGYEDIRKEIVVKTVRDDLPTLVASLRRALDESAR